MSRLEMMLMAALHLNRLAVGVLMAGLMSVMCSALYAENQYHEPPTGGTHLLGQRPLEHFQLHGVDEPDARLRFIDIQGQRFEQALELRHQLNPGEHDDVRIAVEIPERIEPAEVIYLSFFARTRGLFAVKSEHPRDSRGGIWMPLEGDGSWRHYRIPFHAERGYEPGEKKLLVIFPSAATVSEIAAMELINYGSSYELEALPSMTSFVTYPGREDDAPWREEARQRIGQHRMADIELTVLDAEGQPLEGAEVEVHMKRHDFAFGAAINAITWGGIKRGTPEPLSEHLSTQTREKYRSTITELFNEVVIENALKEDRPLVEQSRERRGIFSHEGRRPWTMDLIRWLRENHIRIRGHYLAHGRDLLSDDGWEDRIEHGVDKMQALRREIEEWDALNHPVEHGRLSESLFERYARFMEALRQANPDIDLYVNEGGIIRLANTDWADGYGIGYNPDRHTRSAPYLEVLDYFSEHNVPFDGIGMMGHFAYTRSETWWLSPPEDALARLDEYAAYGKPIKITEYDVQVVDEQLAADYTRDLLTLAYSHPAVEGVIMWGFWDGSHWLNNTPLYRADFSLKPSGEVWKHLVFEKWWTEEQGVSGPDGRFQTRGFHGDYEIQVSYQGQTVTRYIPLGEQGAQMEVRVPWPLAD